MDASKDKTDLTLTDKYKLKGAQQMTYAEYAALKEKQSKGRKFEIPIIVKFILGTPFIIVFCCGILFIPYILYLIATSPSAPPITDEPSSSTSYEDLAKKPR